MSFRWLMTVGILMEVCYLSFYLIQGGTSSVLLFMAVQCLGVLLLGFLVYLHRSSRTLLTSGGQMIGVIIALGMLFRLTLVPHEPVASDDIYRYIWDGKVAAAGVNPFALPPDDSSLNHLHTTDLPSRINHPEMRTIYPPMAQVFFQLSYFLFGDSVAGVKLLLAICDLATMLVLVLLLRHLGLLPEFVIVYAWSPLPVLYFGLDGHVDALGIFLLVLSLFLLVRHGLIPGAVVLGFAALAKLYPLFLAPFLMRVGRSIASLWRPVIPLVIFAAGCWLYLEPGGGLYESFAIFTTTWEFNGSVFNILKLVFGGGNVARIVGAVVFVGWIAWLTFTDRPLIDKVFLGFLGFFIISPTVHPWYFSWLAALLALRWSLAVFVLLGCSALSNVVVYEYRTTGAWAEQPLWLVLEYIPFFLILVWEVVKGDFTATVARSRYQE